METLILRDDTDPSSLVLGLDKDAKKGFIFARASDAVTQFARVEIDFDANSISLFNSSDLGLTVDNNGLTSIHQLEVDGTITANNGVFVLDGSGSLYNGGKIILNGTGNQDVVGTGPDSIGIDFEAGVFSGVEGGPLMEFKHPGPDTVPVINVYTHLRLGFLNEPPNLELTPQGGASFASGKVTVDPDGTVKAPKFQISPDGSMQLGEALAIDQNGIVTNNGGNIYQLSGYNMVFSDGGGPVVKSDSGSLRVIKVDIHGAVYSEPATGV